MINSNKEIKNNGARILIAEDSPTQATQLKYFLEENGYQVYHAKDGEEGFTSALEFRPDLIISDVLSPGGDERSCCFKGT